MRIITASVAIILAMAVRALATSQTPEVIIIDGGIYSLLTNPLENFYKKGTRPKFADSPVEGTDSLDWRGYLGYWEIREDRLYLIGIDAYIDKKKVLLKTLFPGRVKDGRVLADWFSGELRIPEGEVLQPVNMGYGSVYERDVLYTVKSGAVVGRKVIDNTKRPVPSELEQGEKELQKLKEWEEGTKP